MRIVILQQFTVHFLSFGFILYFLMLEETFQSCSFGNSCVLMVTSTVVAITVTVVVTVTVTRLQFAFSYSYSLHVQLQL